MSLRFTPQNEKMTCRHAEVAELSDSGTVLRCLSSHASSCLPWAISAHSHIHSVCPIVPPPYNFSSFPSCSSSSSSSPFSFPSGVREGYVNGQGGGLRKRWEECERGERCCGGHHWAIIFSGKAGCMVRVCVWSVAFLKVCAYRMSEWVVKFAHSSEQACPSVYVLKEVYLTFRLAE